MVSNCGVIQTNKMFYFVYNIKQTCIYLETPPFDIFQFYVRFCTYVDITYFRCEAWCPRLRSVEPKNVQLFQIMKNNIKVHFFYHFKTIVWFSFILLLKQFKMRTSLFQSLKGLRSFFIVTWTPCRRRVSNSCECLEKWKKNMFKQSVMFVLDW